MANEEESPSEDDEEKLNQTQKKFILLEAKKKIVLRILLLCWLLSTTFLTLRTIFESVGADPKSLFAGFIYGVSGFFMLPFFGILPHYTDTIIAGKATFDAPALLAITTYTIVLVVAAIILLVLSRIMKTEEQIDETMKKDKIVDPSDVEDEIQ